MSSGVFQLARYETDQGNVVNIKVQPETIAASIGGQTNIAATADLSPGFPSAKVSGSNREIGINARIVTVKFTAAKTDYKPDSPLKIPALRPAFFNACQIGAEGTYLGTACRVVGRRAESIK